MRVAGATALVTGANRGIGRELVRALLGAGAQRVYATARDADSLGATHGLDPGRVVTVRLDVTDRQSVSAAARFAPDVNFLVNNAGVLEPGDFSELPTEGVRRQFEVNFHGMLDVALAFTPVIASRGGGAIVNMLSLVSMLSAPGIAAYNASKAAAWSMTQSLRATLAPRGIEVYGVYPGAVDTDMTSWAPGEKASAASVADGVIAGVEAGDRDIFPDPMSAHWYAEWQRDRLDAERRFAER